MADRDVLYRTGNSGKQTVIFACVFAIRIDIKAGNRVSVAVKYTGKVVGSESDRLPAVFRRLGFPLVKIRRIVDSNIIGQDIAGFNVVFFAGFGIGSDFFVKQRQLGGVGNLIGIAFGSVAAGKVGSRCDILGFGQFTDFILILYGFGLRFVCCFFCCLAVAAARCHSRNEQNQRQKKDEDFFHSYTLLLYRL